MIITLRGEYENVFILLWLPYKKFYKNYLSLDMFLNLGTTNLQFRRCFVVEAALCVVGYLVASLGSAHSMPEALPIPSCDNQKCLHILSLRNQLTLG